MASKLIVELIDLPLLLSIDFLTPEILIGSSMGPRRSLIIDYTTPFFNGLRRFHSSTHIIIDLVSFEFSAFQLLLENILRRRRVFRCILRLHELHAAAVVVVHVAHEPHSVASGAKGLRLVRRLVLVILDQRLLELVVPLLEILDLHLFRVDL